ncbi:hypothetical protein BH23BAC1_BH23BAC1_22090 [soil metagenome]
MKIRNLYNILFIMLPIGLLSAYLYKPLPEHSGAEFKKHVITTDFISEGVAVGDVNKNGHTDIIAGAYWFEAPDWKAHEIYPGKTYDPAKEYSDSFSNFSLDVNLDGWIDLIVIGFPGEPAVWYENPKNQKGHWQKHSINDSVGVGNESPNFVDVDGDGRKDILCANTKAKQIVWLRAPTSRSSLQWQCFTISEKNAPGTGRFSHGIGLGDINNDGRKDVIVKEGWWESPEDPTQPNWTFHQADLGEDCSHIHVLDENSNGLNDVISSSAHRYGVWWHEQQKDEKEISWKKHVIHDQLSQTHALALEDINGNGYPDLVTGKRFFAHNDTDVDPGAHEPSSLLWFEFMPGKKPYWKTHEIDNDSGAGLNFVVEDMNNNSMLDIVISNKKGVYYFENRMPNKNTKSN